MLKIHHLHNWLSPLPQVIREEIQQLMTTRELADGETLFSQGDSSDEMYQVEEGRIKNCNYSYDGKEAVISTLYSGDSIGEMSVIDGLPRVANAVSVGLSKVRVLSKKHFDALSLKHPEINRQLTIMLSHRMRMFFAMTEDSLLLTLRQRLARYIHRSAVSHSSNTDDGITLLLSVSQEELSKTLGTSRQSVGKELKRLAKEGSIEMRYGKIYVKDCAILARVYDHLIEKEQLTADYSNL